MAQHRAHTHNQQDDTRRRFAGGWSLRSKIVSGVLGAALVGTGAYAVTNWIVGLNAGSSGQAQSATITNLTIAAVATPSPGNLLYPGGSGDVVAKITNPNPYPVTITAVNLPTSTTYAAGYSDSALSLAQSGCSSTTSLVSWKYATGTSGTSHTLATPITVGASTDFTVTFTSTASMDLTSPLACVSTYFSMPSLTGVSATGGSATLTVVTTDTWTS